MLMYVTTHTCCSVAVRCPQPDIPSCQQIMSPYTVSPLKDIQNDAKYRKISSTRAFDNSSMCPVAFLERCRTTQRGRLGSFPFDVYTHTCWNTEYRCLIHQQYRTSARALLLLEPSDGRDIFTANLREYEAGESGRCVWHIDDPLGGAGVSLPHQPARAHPSLARAGQSFDWSHQRAGAVTCSTVLVFLLFAGAKALFPSHGQASRCGLVFCSLQTGRAARAPLALAVSHEQGSHMASGPPVGQG
jgi:hypothetical protein